MCSELARIIARLKKGDPQAFVYIFKRYHSLVFSTLCKTGINYTEAEDICQEVFLAVWEKAYQLNNPDALPGWIRRIARHLGINARIRRSRQHRLLSGLTNYPSSDPPYARLMREEMKKCLFNALARLSPTDRKCLIAFYFEGRSVANIAEILSKPVGTIKRRLHVARKRLKKELDECTAGKNENGEG